MDAGIVRRTYYAIVNTQWLTEEATHPERLARYDTWQRAFHIWKHLSDRTEMTIVKVEATYTITLTQPEDRLS